MFPLTRKAHSEASHVFLFLVALREHLADFFLQSGRLGDDGRKILERQTPPSARAEIDPACRDPSAPPAHADSGALGLWFPTVTTCKANTGRTPRRVRGFLCLSVDRQVPNKAA